LIIPNDANELYQSCALPPVDEVQPAGEMHERGSGREITTICLRSTQLVDKHFFAMTNLLLIPDAGRSWPWAHIRSFIMKYLLALACRECQQ
jgi:hypothetical protein